MDSERVLILFQNADALEELKRLKRRVGILKKKKRLAELRE